jgi:GNAT superfamily N-acetyltransferase
VISANLIGSDNSNRKKIMTKSIIKTAATASDEASTVDVLVRAFSTDPVAQWIWPDPQQYLKHFPSFVRVFGGRAFIHGSADYLDGYTGVALWLPPNVLPDEEGLISIFRHSVSEQNQKNVFALFEQMSRYHPSEPHWYLPLMGVDPLKQGKGFGSVLMQHGLMRCDRDNKPAYLESSNLRNIALYERFGFELLTTIQIGASPHVFPMIRRPC